MSATRAARPGAWALVERLKLACAAEVSVESERWAIATMAEWLKEDAAASRDEADRPAGGSRDRERPGASATLAPARHRG